MRLSFIKKLISIVEESDIGEIEISRFGTRIRITKGSHSREKSTLVKEDLPTIIDTSIEDSEVSKKKEDNLQTITSPMVGTFYRAPAPDAAPYIEEGDHINKGDIICIVEAMKIMNEIESDVSGKVVEIFAKNEEPVEYNQELVLVKKR